MLSQIMFYQSLLRPTVTRYWKCDIKLFLKLFEFKILLNKLGEDIWGKSVLSLGCPYCCQTIFIRVFGTKAKEFFFSFFVWNEPKRLYTDMLIESLIWVILYFSASYDYMVF